MRETQSRILHYRRADFFGSPSADLQKLLAKVHSLLHSDRWKAEIQDGRVVECREFRSTPDEINIHLVSYDPGARAAIVPINDKSKHESLDTAPPPNNAEFWDSSLIATIRKNNVVLLNAGLGETRFENFVHEICRSAEYSEESTFFTLQPVANLDKVKLIQTRGVKSISLKSSLYRATMDKTARMALSDSIFGNLGAELKSHFSKDIGFEQIYAAENLTAELVLSVQGNKKSHVSAAEPLKVISKELIEEEGASNSDFTIHLDKDTSISSNELRLRQKVELPLIGKAADSKAAWEAIASFFNDLEEWGALEK